MARERFRFGAFLLDAGRGALLEHGIPVAIGSKALSLLRALVEARGEVVSKAALMDAAWPDTNVEESNLTVQIAALRSRLRGSQNEEDWIVTFRGIGYRFAGPLSVEEREAPAVQPKVPTLGPKPSIAILPFATVGSDPEQTHFATGLADQLIADMSKLAGLLVVAHDSSLARKARLADIRSVARELGVGFVVGGSLRRAGDRVRVGAHLTEATTGRHLWVERFDGDLADTLSLQDEVAGRVVAIVANALAAGPPISHPYPTNIEAHDFFVRGRELVMCSPKGNGLARRLLGKAIELEPGFPGAYACLAISHYGAAINYDEDPETNRSLGLAYARKAVSLGRNDPVAHRALAFVHLYAGKPDEAESEIQTALRINPDFADGLAATGGLRVLQGRPTEAIALLRRALSINSFPPGWYFWDLGFGCYAASRYADAVEVLSRDEIERSPARRILAASYAQLGLMTDAVNAAREFLKVNPRFRASTWANTQAFERPEDRQHFVDGYRKAGLPF